jgi:WD40 repeat protein
VPLQSSMLFFGPESARPGFQQEEDATGDGESETGTNRQGLSPKSASARKHARESGPNGAADQAVQPAPKRSRKTAPNSERERNIERLQVQPTQQLQQSPQPQQAQQAQHAQQIAESTIEDRVPMEVDPPDGHANSASSDSGPPMPEAGSASPSDPDQDTDMDMGVSNGVAQGLEVGNGGFAGAAATGVLEAPHQERMNELVAAIPTLDTGRSLGVQCLAGKNDESELLLPESTVLHVADEAHVTDASWRPSDPTVLAASGHDFVGLWKIANQPSPPGAVLPPFQNVIDRRDDQMVSAMAWEPGGSMLAIAVFDNHTAGAIRIYDGQEGVLIESLPAAQRLITNLRWQKVGSRLMGFSASAEESSLVLWDLSGSMQLPGAFSITVPEQVHDISWASHGNTSIVCAAGDGVVYQCRAVPDLVIEQKWASSSSHQTSWNLVKCSWWSEETAIIVAACASPPMLWVPAKNIYARDIHNGAITSLDLRPTQMVHPDRTPHCDFATCSVDGSVKIWRYSDHAGTIECVFKLCMTDSAPVLGLAYTPDGHALAAASYNRVLLWKAEKRGPPVAKWEGAEDSWGGSYLKRQRRVSQGETMSEDGAREDTGHSLTWDADSRKLAFALGNQVCPPSLSPSLIPDP